ncbi:phosphodiesterase [Paenarthrobacter ureafaciens]|uniref:phosphodiesterase n=1 Tax=Paenarthrobacter TaxID=1742992 RepID=UPI0022303A80|nr:phosphodiesterase [Paenarthrobacter sp. PAE-2]MCW3767079.1 phosphodiesterase [Paenarthrobacter sp. PAE-2]
MELFEAEYPKPGHVLLHLSDLHLLGGARALHGAVDSTERLREVCQQIIDSRIQAEAVIFTGDLAEKGELEAYERLREVVEPLCAALGATPIWAMGNHDNRANFRAVFPEAAKGSRPMDPMDRSYFVNGLRIITLDTTVPGHHHGELSEEQLEWLADELSTPAPDGTILALHHPPVPCVQDLAVLVELRDQARLAAVVGNSDVRAILGGHLHYSTSATFAGVPVSVASATCYTQDLAVGAGGQRGRDGAQAYNMVHVYEDTIVHSVVPLSGGDTVGEELDAEGVRRRLEAAGVAIPGQSRTRFRGKTRLSTSPKVP